MIAYLLMYARHMISLRCILTETEIGATRSMALPFGVIHAVVDATSVTVVYLAVPVHQLPMTAAFFLVVGYDVLAFASQALFGLVADRFGLARAAMLAGIVLVGLSILSLPESALFTLVLAGTGNALFHLGAGALVLCQAPARAAPSGVFVAPGALGLAAGIWMGRDGGLEAPWPLLPLVVAAFIVAWRNKAARDIAPMPKQIMGKARPGIIVLLMASIAIRAFVGIGGSHACPKTVLIQLGLPLAAFLGKALGGSIADRLGWLETSVGVLLLSMPLIVLGGTSPLMLLTGMTLFQMTMPVTLVAMSLALPHRPATAFGLTCLALIGGALPTFFPVGQTVFGPIPFALCIVVSAVAVGTGLFALNVPRPRDQAASCQMIGRAGRSASVNEQHHILKS